MALPHCPPRALREILRRGSRGPPGGANDLARCQRIGRTLRTAAYQFTNLKSKFVFIDLEEREEKVEFTVAAVLTITIYVL